MNTEIGIKACEEKMAALLAERVILTGKQQEKQELAERNLALLNALMGKAYNIALVGFMGAGKSTVSHYLKEVLALPEKETDAMIVESEGMAITEIFEKHGEPYFRELESKTVISLQDSAQAIISCGGGLVVKEENVVNLKKSSRIVLLTATPETTLERVKDSTERPILNGHMNVEYIAELMEKRREKYQNAADITIATDHKEVDEICAELIQKLAIV